MVMAPAVTVGGLVRGWRTRRHLSQLELALRADLSARHLSFVETGRALPSRDLLLRLAERLDVPLRDRNQLLLAAGYAPIFPETSLHSPQMRAVREAVRQLLAGHEPYPALVVDRWWHLVEANSSVFTLLAGVADDLLAPPVNVLRLSLHPEGLAPRIVNLGQWRAHLLGRLTRQAELTADPELEDLLRELEGYPGGGGDDHGATGGPTDVVVPLRLRLGDGRELALLSTVATFGTPLDVTVAELVIESFFPADSASGEELRKLVSGNGG